MDVRNEIVRRVDNLPLEVQVQVLRFVESLAPPALKGEPGSNLLRFSGYLDHEAVRAMSEAIEDECERVDAGEW